MSMARLRWLWLNFVTGVSRRAGPSIQHPLPLELVPHTEALSTNLFDRDRLPAQRCAQNRMVGARQPARQPVTRAARTRRSIRAQPQGQLTLRDRRLSSAGAQCRRSRCRCAVEGCGLAGAGRAVRALSAGLPGSGVPGRRGRRARARWPAPVRRWPDGRHDRDVRLCMCGAPDPTVRPAAGGTLMVQERVPWKGPRDGPGGTDGGWARLSGSRWRTRQDTGR